jgi:ATP-dependent RNA helicase RhlE
VSPLAPTFSDLGLAAPLLRVVELAGYTHPTPVQIGAIPAVLAGRDLQAHAHTGSGKTAAFGLPLLQRLCQQGATRARGNHASVLVLAPTRELAIQISEVLQGFVRALLAEPLQPLRVLSVTGGVSINPQMLALRGGVDVLIATPGRLLDLHRQHAVRLEQTGVLVLDEADRLLSLGFADELAAILALLPPARQTLLFSATFPSALSGLRAALREPVELALAAEAEPQIEEHVYTCREQDKGALLAQLIEQRDMRQVLVFVSAKRTGDLLARKLSRAGIESAVFHADKSQSERTRCLASFRGGQLRVLIASDLAARGIDVEELPVVVNVELPRAPGDYVHRIGRTGRAGRTGLAITLLAPAEYHHFSVIEKRIKRKLTREQVAGFAP